MCYNIILHSIYHKRGSILLTEAEEHLSCQLIRSSLYSNLVIKYFFRHWRRVEAKLQIIKIPALFYVSRFCESESREVNLLNDNEIDFHCFLSSAGGRASLFRDGRPAKRGGADLRDRSADEAAVVGQRCPTLLLPLPRIPAE